MTLDKSHQVASANSKEKNKQNPVTLDYLQLIGYMKELRAFFHKEYNTHFKLGNIYQGNPDFSYFSLTPEELKKHKLKFVIVLNHKTIAFSICLSGQNKDVRKKYWERFKNSDWNTYHLATSIDNSLSIIDQTIIEIPDFNNKRHLTEQIQRESLAFINEIKNVLE